jgi:hypothetical protein
MALGDNTTSVARGNGARGRQPYFIQHEINFATAVTDKGTALAAGDVVPGLTIPANTVILHAGFEVTAAHAGTSTDCTLDLGITGGDLDNFVDGFDFDGASVGDYASTPAAYAPVIVGGTSDTLDIEIQTQTGTTTGGKVRLFATLMDIDDVGTLTADEVDRDTLA